MMTLTHFGRKAYGPQRRVTKKQQARFIAEAIQRYARQGVVKAVHDYTSDPVTREYALAQLGRGA